MNICDIITNNIFNEHEHSSNDILKKYLNVPKNKNINEMYKTPDDAVTKLISVIGKDRAINVIKHNNNNSDAFLNEMYQSINKTNKGDLYA